MDRRLGNRDSELLELFAGPHGEPASGVAIRDVLERLDLGVLVSRVGELVREAVERFSRCVLANLFRIGIVRALERSDRKQSAECQGTDSTKKSSSSLRHAVQGPATKVSDHDPISPVSGEDADA
jgi:hypothetical protein